MCTVETWFRTLLLVESMRLNLSNGRDNLNLNGLQIKINKSHQDSSAGSPGKPVPPNTSVSSKSLTGLDSIPMNTLVTPSDWLLLPSLTDAILL